MLQKLRSRLGDMSTIKLLLETAEAIGRRDGHDEPAAEHLVLAALELPDRTAGASLGRCGSSAEAFAAALREQHTAALVALGVTVDDDAIDASLPEPSPATGVYRSEASAQDLFQRASTDARAGGGGLLGAHVMRAASTLERGTVARTFEQMGIDAQALHAAATAEIAAARTR